MSSLKPNKKEAARQYAYLLLKVRPRSINELNMRLKRKGIPQEIIDSIIVDFKKRGLLDDVKFSKLLASSRLDYKGTGLKSIAFELKKKGIDEEVIDKTIDELRNEYNEYEIAKGIVEEKMPSLKGLSTLTVKRRIYNLLARRGFDNSVIWQVIKDLNINEYK